MTKLGHVRAKAPLGFEQHEGHLLTVRYALSLAVLCSVGVLLVFVPIFASGHGCVWSNDGVSQQLNSLIFSGRTLREVFRGLLFEHRLHFPQYIFTVGYGLDVEALTGLRDPFNWLAVFVPARFCEYLYFLLIIVRVFVAALAFSFYVRSKGNSLESACLGALIYVFAGFPIFLGMLRHPDFINAMIFLPILLWGADRILQGRSLVAFCATLALSFCVNLYFSYMICCFLLIYFIFWCVSSHDELSLPRFLKLVGAFMFCAVVALCISGVISVPYVLSVSGTSRTSAKTIVQAFFPIKFYEQTFSNIVGASYEVFGAKRLLGSVCVLLFLVAIAGQTSEKLRSQCRPWILAVLLCVAFSIFPYFGHVFNGFSYVSDRWYFAFDFCAAYLACLVVGTLPLLSKGQWWAVRILAVLWCLLCWQPVKFVEPVWPISLAILFLLLCLLLMELLVRYATSRVRMAVLCALVLMGGGMASKCLCASNVSFVDEFWAPAWSLYDNYHAYSPYAAMEQLPSGEREFYRYSVTNPQPYHRFNESLNLNRDGLLCYASFYNQSLDDYRDELGLADSAFPATYSGSNSRLAIDAFAGAKYFLANNEEGWRVPASYEDSGIEQNGYKLYKTASALPLAFTYDRVMLKDEYLSLNMVERQEAQLQVAVLDELPTECTTEVVDAGDLVKSSQELPFTVTSQQEGIQVFSDHVEVSKPRAAATLSFANAGEGEYYLCFSDLSFEEPGMEDDGQTEHSGMLRDLDAYHLEWYYAFAKTSLGEASFYAYTPYSFQFDAKDDWALNLGYAREGIDSLELSFDAVGTYRFSSLSVHRQEVAPLVNELSARKACGASSWSHATDTCSFSIDTKQSEEYALVTYPYSPGWSARVDGEVTDVFPVNTGFCGLRIKGPGRHKVEMFYETPGRRIGAFLSLAGLLVLVAVELFQRGQR